MAFLPVLLALAALLAPAQAPPQAPDSSSLDYAYFRDRVQPIFLAKRPGSARCYSCHSQGTSLRLQRLSEGTGFWDEEQSRRNFETTKRVVLPNVPLKSRLLTHPLAVAAGGDLFHGGGKHWTSQDNPEWQTLSAWVRGATLPAPTLAARIVQTNSAGDNITLIDPVTDRIVGEVRGIEVNHGVAASPDGRRLYVTNESQSTVDVVDVMALSVIKQVPLTGHPNNIAIGKDGRKVYVAIAQAPGAVDVIDTTTLERVDSIAVEGALHNVYVTPDGRFVVAGSIPGRKMTVIDAATGQIAWTIGFENGVRPITFETNPDGSTSRMFVQISNYHGFAVVDVATRTEVARVAFPEKPAGVVTAVDGIQGAPAHGLAISPDGRTLWANSKLNNHVYAYSLPDLKLVGGVAVGSIPDWLTFAPSGKLYIANAGENTVTVVDTRAMRVSGIIPVGQAPKRNLTAMLVR